MKRNPHIERKMGWIISLGIIFLVFGILLIGFQTYVYFNSENSDYITFGAIALFFLVLRLVKIKMESILLKKLKSSEEFQKLLDLYNLKDCENDYYEGCKNGYFITLENHITERIFYNEKPTQLFLDIFCDCSELSPTEISEIEDKDFIVTHHSIRKVSSSWFNRFKANKLGDYLDKQMNIISKYNLEIIIEEKLKNDE